MVFIPETPKGAFPASGIQIVLFTNVNQKLVATAVSGDSGQFEIKDVAPGDYTLITAGESFHQLCIPLRVRANTPEHPGPASALLLRLYSSKARRTSTAALITNSSLRTELLKRVTNDQAIRNEWIQHGADKPDKDIDARMAAIDADNLTRMKEIVRIYRWPGPALVGFDGAEAAFVLVQHANHDFQKDMLPHVRRAFLSGALAGQDYALLLDRVLVAEGRKQVYGTQAMPMDRWKNREPALDPIEDEAHVDQRRAKLGLFPLAEYVKLLKDAYFPTVKDK